MTHFLSEFYKDQRIAEGAVFRCDRCDSLFPLGLLVDQDGMRICSVRCVDRPGRLEAAQMASEAAQRAAMRPSTPLPFPIVSRFTGPAITDITPGEINLTRGGAAVTVLLAGVNLASTDARTYSAAGITEDSATFTTTLATLGLKASGGAVPGDYHMTYAGARIPLVIKVR